MGRLIMRRIMPVKHVRLGIPIDLPFCLRFDEFSYIAINNVGLSMMCDTFGKE